jgi:lipopolysaccharide export system protein LptA
LSRLILAFALVALGLPSAALAQSAGIAFGDAGHDSDAPIEVTSDQLNVDQTDGTAVFTGNVVVVQGAFRLTADRVEVEYTKTEPREIDRMLAFDNVVIVRGAEAAEGNEAVYTLADRVVVMTGDVLLTQEQSAISGDLLTIQLDDGTGVMEGRVRTILQTGGN